MINTFDKQTLSYDVCDKIIEQYRNKVALIEIKNLRRQRNHHETDPDSWLFKLMQNLVTVNIGSEYKVINRVTILKYVKDDYFAEHTDGTPNTRLNPTLPFHFYGGIELNDESEYEGGKFLINKVPVERVRGQMFTHSFSTRHEVTPVTSGIRWSLHCPITKLTKKII